MPRGKPLFILLIYFACLLEAVSLQSYKKEEEKAPVLSVNHVV